MNVNSLRRSLALLAAVGAVTGAGLARASSHREAPAISNDPQADNTDLWAWVDPSSHANVHIVASYIPLEEPSGGPNFHKFSDDVLYEIHIARGDTSLADVVTYQFRFTTAPITIVPQSSFPHPIIGGQEFFAQLAGSFAQTYSVTKITGGTTTVLMSGIPVAPPNIGPRTQTVAYKAGAYNDAYAATFVTALAATGTFETVWAGPRDDGFYVDLGGIFDLANLRAKGVAQDGVSGFNTHTIAIDIPSKLLTFDGNAPADGATDQNTLAIWASASRPKVNILRNDGTHTGVGPWVQVSRIGLPLINEAVIGLQDKDKYNRTQPINDVSNFAGYFLNPVIVKDAEAVGIYPVTIGSTTYTGTAQETNRTDILNVINLTNQPSAGAHTVAIANGSTGDVLRVDLGLDPAFPDGRALVGGASANQEAADVTDVELSLLLLGTTSGISDGVDYNDANYLASIPYLALPWRGFDQGHGIPTP